MIKSFNKQKQEWVPQTSNLAKHKRVIDAEGNYESDNVEGCLQEIAHGMKKMKNDITYIYENGTIGGGGGGGGSAIPTLTTDYQDGNVTSTDEVVIPYFFNTPNVGKGKVFCSINNSEVYTGTIDMGKNTWKVGRLVAGEVHVLKMYAIDAAGMYTNELAIRITCGSLELSDRYESMIQFKLGSVYSITYDVKSVSSEPIQVQYTIDQTVYPKEDIQEGKNVWTLPNLTMGQYKVKIKAFSDGVESNTLEHTVLIVDSSTLYLGSDFSLTEIKEGTEIVVPFIVSMDGEIEAVVKGYIDDLPVSTATVKTGIISSWSIGQLDKRELPYKLKLIAETVDGRITTAETPLEFEVTIIDNGLTSISPVTNGLVAWFDARHINCDNNSENRNIWVDKSGNDTHCELFHFNYSSNGWLQITDDDDEKWVEDGITTYNKALTFNGETYAIVDTAPFANNCPEGVTIDFTFKTKNAGDMSAIAMSCMSLEEPFHGIYVDTVQAVFNSFTQQKSMNIAEDQWTRLTFVVDREKFRMLIYIDGVVSSIKAINSQSVTSEIFTHDSKIYLNCKPDGKGGLGNFGTCWFKNLRVYNRALTHAEVVTNHLADMFNKTVQQKKYLLNQPDTLPTLYMDGDLSSLGYDNAGNLVEGNFRIRYVPRNGYGEMFDLPKCKVSWQGTSSKQYDVKNFRIKLKSPNVTPEYPDGEPFMYSPCENWQPEDRFTLKADYMESSHANNVGTAVLIHENMYTTPTPPQVQHPSKNIRTTIDGFPVVLYIKNTNKANAKYECFGTFMFNLDKAASNNFGFDKSNGMCMSYEALANGNSGAVAFMDGSDQAINEHFELRFPDEVKKTSHPELRELIEWVRDADEYRFKDEIVDHLSLPHCIDYYLLVVVLGMVDNLGKNMMLNTWDGRIWYPSFYDMDTLIGLDNSGRPIIQPDAEIKSGVFNTSNSLLWTKLWNVFHKEIKARYAELRTVTEMPPGETDPLKYMNAFNVDKIMTYYKDYIVDKIGESFYNDDADIKYFNNNADYHYMAQGTRLKACRKWLTDRLLFCDTIFDYGKYTNETVSFRSNKAGETTIRIKTYSPQYVTVKFTNGQEVRKLCNKDKFTEFVGNIQSTTDQEVMITNAQHLMEIDNIRGLNLNSLFIGNAIKLAKLDVSGSTRLTELAVSGNTYLQELRCNDCPLLETELDVSQCTNLKYLDASNSPLTSIKLNPQGGNFTYLNLNNTKITQFELKSQAFLKSLQLQNCSRLSIFTVEDCSALEVIEMPGSILTDFTVIKCGNLKQLNISGGSRLKNLNLYGCPNITHLNVSGISGSPENRFKILDLSQSAVLEELNVSNCGFLNYIIFHETSRTLKRFICNSSALKSVRYGKPVGDISDSSFPTYLDLSRFTLTGANFNNCSLITRIKNLTIEATNGSPFYNCVNLTGFDNSTVKLIGTAHSAFAGCKELIDWPTLDLTEVTSGNYTFSNCKKLNLTNFKKIMAQLGNLTSQYQFFAGCTGILTGPQKNAGGGISHVIDLPSDLFSKLTKLTTMSEMFINCSGFGGEIPTGWLKSLTSLTSAYCAFYNCAFYGDLPQDLFSCISSDNQKLTTIESMFRGNTQLTSIPLGLLSTLKALKNTGYCFSGCSGLVCEIPQDFFKYNQKLEDISGTFNGCSKLYGSIPGELLHNLPYLKNASSLFSGCSKLTGEIPPKMFYTNGENTSTLLSIDYFFNGCSGLRGSIPDELLSKCQYLQNAHYLFGGCSGLTHKIVDGIRVPIPNGFLAGKASLYNISGMFSGCSNLQGDIPGNLLDGCTALAKVNSLFRDCSGLTGAIPQNLLSSPKYIDDAAYLFYNCYNLTGYIPPLLFEKCSLVIDLSYAFYECRQLEGGIPVELFSKCISLEKLNYTFWNCDNIGEKNISEDNPYAIPENLFIRNVNLKELQATFRWCEKLKGDLPEGLFNNCSDLVTTYSMFRGVPLTGPVPEFLFAGQTDKLKDVSEMFMGCSGLTTIQEGMFGSYSGGIINTNVPNIANFSNTFSSCSGLTGRVPQVWDTHPRAAGANCYTGVSSSKVTNYNDIPSSHITK